MERVLVIGAGVTVTVTTAVSVHVSPVDVANGSSATRRSKIGLRAKVYMTSI